MSILNSLSLVRNGQIKINFDADHYQIISSYFEDDCADELTNELVMTATTDPPKPSRPVQSPREFRQDSFRRPEPYWAGRRLRRPPEQQCL